MAVLAVRAAFGSRYKLYAHERGAEQVGLDPATIATLAVGQRPVTLSDEEQASFGIASVLATGRHLPQSTYRWALELSGEQQVAELVYLVGGYSLVSVLLNAFDVPVPERDDA